MKVAIPIDENKRTVCVSFGRAPYFGIYDVETGERGVYVNAAANARGGAGISAAQFVSDRGADAVITFRCGENASAVLKSAGIKIYAAADADVESNLDSFKKNALGELNFFHAGFHGGR